MDDLKILIKKKKENGISNINTFYQGCYSYNLELCKYIYENGFLEKTEDQDFINAAIVGYHQEVCANRSPSMELINYLSETCGFKPVILDSSILVAVQYDCIFEPGCIDILKYITGMGYNFKMLKTTIEIFKKVNSYHYWARKLLFEELQKEKVKLLVFLNGKLPYRYVRMEILLAIKWAHLFTPAEVFSLSQ